MRFIETADFGGEDARRVEPKALGGEISKTLRQQTSDGDYNDGKGDL